MSTTQDSDVREAMAALDRIDDFIARCNGDDRGSCADVNLLRAVLTKPEAQAPRHKFWGAGEPDCPPELLTPNGELHTTRCKVCGDGWRRNRDACLGALSTPAPAAPEQGVSAVPEGCTPADAMVLRKANHALAEDNERLRTALRFYANGEHFNTDDKEEFDTVSGEPTNWLCSGVDGSTTMIEDGAVAAMALRGIDANWKDGDEDLTPKPIDGEQWSSPTQPASAPAREGESELAVLMDRNAWRAAMIGLCTGRDYDVRTPELAAEHLRKRLATPATPAQPREAQAGGVDDAWVWRGLLKNGAAQLIGNKHRVPVYAVQAVASEVCKLISSPAPRAPSIEPVGEAEIVGDTRFEGWLSEHEITDVRGSKLPMYHKQDMREAYWAGYKERASLAAPASAGVEPTQAREAEPASAKQIKLRELADRIDHEKLWSRPALEHRDWPQEKRDRMDAGVALRRYSDLLEPNRWLIFPPSGPVQFSAVTLDDAVRMAKKEEARRAASTSPKGST